MSPELIAEFDAWVDRVSAECAGSEVGAFGFLLYEHEQSLAVQLVGAGRYVDSEPFASDVLCSSGEDLVELPRSSVGSEWQGLAAATNLVRGYLTRRATGGPFERATVAIGFVVGDIEVLQSAAPPN